MTRKPRMSVRRIVMEHLDAEGYDRVVDVVRQWLEDHEYTGLCGEECGCRLDDLMPCECPPGKCVPGHANQDGVWPRRRK